MSRWRQFLLFLKSEPAILSFAISGAVTAWAAFGFRAPAADVTAASMIGTALVTVITAFFTRPVSVPVVDAATTEIFTAAGAFGLHLTAAQVGAIGPLVSIVLSLLLRQALTPTVNLPKRAHP